MSQAFGSDVRLRTRAEFDHVQRGGRRVSLRVLTMVGRPNALARDRLGIIASRKIGGAVVRNRAKRRIREIFRRDHPDAVQTRGERALDIVVIARQAMVEADYAVIEAEFRAALRTLRGAAAGAPALQTRGAK